MDFVLLLNGEMRLFCKNHTNMACVAQDVEVAMPAIVLVSHVIHSSPSPPMPVVLSKSVREGTGQSDLHKVKANRKLLTGTGKSHAI